MGWLYTATTSGMDTQGMSRWLLHGLLLATFTQLCRGLYISGLKSYEDVMDKRIEDTLQMFNNPYISKYLQLYDDQICK